MPKMKPMRLNHINGDTEGFDPSDALTDELNRMTMRQVEAVMKARGLNLTQLAERTGVNQATLSSHMGGGRPVSLKVLVRCALALDAKVTINFKEN